MKHLIWTFAFILFIPAIHNAQLTEGLVLHLGLDGEAIDLSENENDGIIINAVPITDQFGNSESALYFDGTSSIVLPNSESIKPQLPLTLSMIIKADSLYETKPLYHSDVSSNNYSGFFVNLTAEGKIMAHIGSDLGNNGPNNRRSYLSSGSIKSGQWHSIIIIFHAFDDMEIYIDCNESGGVYSGTGTTEIIYTDVAGGIGEGGATNNFPQGYFLEGALDEVRLWNRALTQEEVMQVCSPVSTDIEISEHQQISIYPNPAQDFIIVEAHPAYKNEEIIYTIQNYLGQVIESGRIHQNKESINTKNLTVGLYNITVRNQKQLLFSSLLSITD